MLSRTANNKYIGETLAYWAVELIVAFCLLCFVACSEADWIYEEQDSDSSSDSSSDSDSDSDHDTDSESDVAPLIIITSELEHGVSNTAYTDQLESTGGMAPFTWSAWGLPDGLSLDPDSGEIYGATELADCEDGFDVTIEVQDASEQIASLDYQLWICAPLEFTNQRWEPANVGEEYVADSEVEGGAMPYKWDATGLPSGIEIDEDTGGLSGETLEYGTFSVILEVTDDFGVMATDTFDLVVRPIVITLYFAGSQGVEEDWDINRIWPLLPPERPRLVQSLYHLDRSRAVTKTWLTALGPIEWEIKNTDGKRTYKAFIDGVAAKSPIRANLDPSDGNMLRNWDRCVKEGMKAIEKVLTILPSSRLPVVLNLVGYSRGGVLTMKMARKVSKTTFDEAPEVKEVNIIALDPVPGEKGQNPQPAWLLYARNKPGAKTLYKLGKDAILPPIVKRYVGVYVEDERSWKFEPLVPALEDPEQDTQMWMFSVPGSHLTLVNILNRLGHGPWPIVGFDKTGPLKESEHNEKSSLKYVVSVTWRLCETLLSSNGWGGLLFGKFKDQQDKSPRLTDLARSTTKSWNYLIDQMNKVNYSGMRNVTFLSRATASLLIEPKGLFSDVRGSGPAYELQWNSDKRKFDWKKFSWSQPNKPYKERLCFKATNPPPSKKATERVYKLFSNAPKSYPYQVIKPIENFDVEKELQRLSEAPRW